MYRYFNPKGGKVKASAETMRMYKTEEGRNSDAGVMSVCINSAFR